MTKLNKEQSSSWIIWFLNLGVILCMVYNIFIFCKEIAIKKEEEEERWGRHTAVFLQYILISEKKKKKCTTLKNISFKGYFIDFHLWNLLGASGTIHFETAFKMLIPYFQWWISFSILLPVFCWLFCYPFFFNFLLCQFFAHRGDNWYTSLTFFTGIV